MKVLVFTHKSDIDGMGGAVLSKLAFEDVEYVLCETFSLSENVNKYIQNGSIYSYDRIYITDLCLDLEMLEKVSNDVELKDKLLVFDHHKTAMDNNVNCYPFVHVQVENEMGLCSGTSLFWEYLKETKLLVSSKTIEEFVELTRRYDTWEWKTKYNDESARKLTLLFDAVGCDGYIKLLTDKLRKKSDCFMFDELEGMLIQNKENQSIEKMQNYAKKIYYREVLGFKAGIAFIDYEYRNDLAEFFRMNGYDMDFAMLISMDKKSISYRTIKEGVNVRLIAEAMGGNGHDKAASSPIVEQQLEEILKVLVKM